jgi:hypothetical protein
MNYFNEAIMVMKELYGQDVAMKEIMKIQMLH